MLWKIVSREDCVRNMDSNQDLMNDERENLDDKINQLIYL